jgi:PAS domain S-box-containing protein
MYKGGAAYNDRAQQLFRYGGLLAPLILVVYGFFVQGSLIYSTHYSSDVIFTLISILALILGVMQFLFPARHKHRQAVYISSYHLMVMAYLLFVSGLTMPIVVFWILLFIIANRSFDLPGLRYSILAFAVTMTLDMVLAINAGISTSALFEDLITFAAVITTGLAVVMLGRTHLHDQAALSKSHATASLERDRILTIVNNLADAILSTDQKGIIRMYNAASLNLLDTNDSLNGRHIDEVLHLLDQDNEAVPLYRALIESRSVIAREDLHFVLDQEEDIRLALTYSPIRSSYSKNGAAHDGYIIILRDITKAKSLEEERDEFISVVSHELRTPITIAEGTISNAQLMMSRSDIAPDVLQTSMKTAHDQVIYLAKMVNDLSTLSRAERGVADSTEIIDVKEMVNKLFNEYHPEAEAKGLHLNLDIGSKLGMVNASRLYLEELLQNFITNAIKYTREGSVTFRVHAKDSQVTFAVQDTGIGISRTDQKKIFQKFYRSEDYRTRETGGTGLGLYVAAKLAKKIGCKIELESRLNHGSTFHFTLPLTKD